MQKSSVFSTIAFIMMIIVFMMACDSAASDGTNGATGYTVVFNAGGGTVEPSTVSVNSGARVTEPASETLSHGCYATMEGWYTDEQFTNKFDFTTPITDTITLYANWTNPNDVPQKNADEKYALCGWKQLQWITAHDETNTVKKERYSYDYILIGDIAFPSPGTDGFPAHGFIPIGNSGLPFTGTFDGNGHTITNFFMNVNVASWPNTRHKRYIGLFGQVSGADALVTRFTIASPNIDAGVGDLNVGALHGGAIAGELIAGKITNVAVTGSGTVYGCGSNVGGLVGSNRGGTVHGYVAGVIVGAKAAATVCSQTGGLAGSLPFGTVIGYFSGELRSAGHFVGGLVGISGDAADSSKKGLVIGYVSGKLLIGSALGSQFFGPVVGSNKNNGPVYAYWDKANTGHASSSVGISISDIEKVYKFLDKFYDAGDDSVESSDDAEVFNDPTFLEYFSLPRDIGQWPSLNVME